MEPERNASPSRPKFPVVKETYEIFDKRVTRIAADVGYKENIHRLNYFKKMKKLRSRMLRLLETYPQYLPEPGKYDPSKAYIPPEQEKRLQRLSTPPKRFVKQTLILINQLIRSILDDHQFHSNEFKVDRVCELMRYRKQVCRLFLGYEKSPEPSIYCLRFRPCSLKMTPIHAVVQPSLTVSKKNLPYLRKFKTRMLKFKFDEDTNNLALPSYQRVNATHELHFKFLDQIKQQLLIDQVHNESYEKKSKLIEMSELVLNRLRFLEGLKNEIENIRGIKSENEEDIEIKPGGYLHNFLSFEQYDSYLEFPSKAKLQEARKYQNELLIKVKKEAERGEFEDVTKDM